MRGQKGQASILIAVIFQLLFVFFAMVINVGLLVHDKINLQNSTDIAAYYAAMKQAEVLNTMAQLNYQIHQSWKLFAWRLWVLGDAGRNSNSYETKTNTLSGSIPGDVVATWLGKAAYPIVCVTNPFWKEGTINGKPENLCANTNLDLAALLPPTLTIGQGAFSGIFSIFVGGIANQNNLFKGDFNKTGLTNYQEAVLFLASFKIAAAHRRFAIHHLQNLLLQSSTDFFDLGGMSVKTAAQTTLTNNLTASNKANGVTFEFQNGLNSGTPFMVPIEVRAYVKYLDFDTKSKVTSTVKDIDVASSQDNGAAASAQVFWFEDYNGAQTIETASDFAGEVQETLASNPNSFKSLIGFEKNPWVLAYVRVAATTHPKMLFSPIIGTSGITLTAESYAMPFGGRMGPWYYDSWPSGKGSSIAGQPIANTNSAAPRMDGQPNPNTAFPNYSRYPGDTLGLSSQLARDVGVRQIFNNRPSYSDYDFMAAYGVSDPKIDPIVATLPGAAATPALRPAEMAAVAPDLFDATYYSASYDFPSRYLEAYSSQSGSGLGSFSAYDLGNDVSQLVTGALASPAAISQLFFVGTSPSFSPNPSVWGQLANPPFWILKQPQHLNTSWSQGDPGHYDDAQAELSVGQTWEFPGSSDPTAKPQGGRAGYSVKLVSKQFLLRNNLPLGGSNETGPIANPPQP